VLYLSSSIPSFSEANTGVHYRYALYSGLSPGFQKYLEGLTALHSAVEQAEGARAAGLPVRRHEIQTVHPVVRVHPVTGWKTVFVNPGMLSPPLPLSNIQMRLISLCFQVSQGAFLVFLRRSRTLFCTSCSAKLARMLRTTLGSRGSPTVLLSGTIG
jgi:hypothetical protein